jgi:NAD-reducing hydrogenase large subunit
VTHASTAVISFHFHYARLIEATHALEQMEHLLDDPAILGTKVRATAGVNDNEGVGIIEAPRGTLIHHYRVDDNGAIAWGCGRSPASRRA